MKLQKCLMLKLGNLLSEVAMHFQKTYDREKIATNSTNSDKFCDATLIEQANTIVLI